jgi:Glycosyltransferase (GlcNAc)
MSDNKIFIQIAAYKDPELVPTIKNCISNAKYPENLKFCIAWQHDAKDYSMVEYKNNPNFEILDIPAEQSKGACWARNQIQYFYSGEKYTLQLDSHHRFVKNWDEILINMYEDLVSKGHKKPLITSYIPSYDPENDPDGRKMEPWWMTFDRFIPEGAVFFLPAAIPNWKSLTEPIKARFYSAHFCFTTGKFCEEVPHDPEYYFHGEEISIAVRAYTHGYDLFHPHNIIAWHEYTRKNRVKHWDDHRDWFIKNNSCHKRNRKLLGVDGESNDIDFGRYGFGTERTVQDYEQYAGICFSDRSSSEDLRSNKPPKENTDKLPYDEWKNSLQKVFKHCINVHKNSLNKDGKYDFIAVIFKDEDDNEIYRKDANKEEIKQIFDSGKNSDFYNIWRSFSFTKKPSHWVVWPYSEENGWGKIIEGNL